MLGWVNSRQAVITEELGDSVRVEVVDLDGDAIRLVDQVEESRLSLSPDAEWLVERAQHMVGDSVSESITVLRVDNPTLRRNLVLPRMGMLSVYWRLPPMRSALSSIAIIRAHDTITTNAPYHLTLRGADAAGKPVMVPTAVTSWRSSDSTIATVDASGVVHGLRAGSVTITASAGGWLEGSAKLVVARIESKLVYEESWEQDWPASWQAWGTPLPRVVANPKGGRAMLPNGDGEYSSGLASMRAFDARGGLALDVMVSTPITRPKWQFMQVDVRARAPLAASGPTGAGCALRYPSGEGWLEATKISDIVAPPYVMSGQWYRLRIQVFPDGGCGYALNGKPMRTDSRMHVVPDSMIIAFGGQTVGSDLLVGRVQVWTGVPDGVDWRGVGVVHGRP